MKYCKECGKELNLHAKFCNGCGTPVEVTNADVDLPENTYHTPVTQKESRKPLSRKAKIAMIASGTALVVLFGGYQALSAFTSKDRLIDQFHTALIDNDAKKAASLLSSDDPKAKIDENSVKGLLKYYKENPDEINDLFQDLSMQAKLYDQNDNSPGQGLTDLASDFLNQDMIGLDKDSKLLFFNRYKLNVNTVYLNVSTNYKNTKLYVDGKKVGEAKSQDYQTTVGPFLPGIHEAKADLKSKFVDLKTKKEIKLINTGNKASVDLTLDGQDVTIDLGQSEGGSGRDYKGKLYINGKDVGINPFKNYTFGPVLTDGSMKLSVSAEMPWGKVKTEEVPIKGSEVSLSLVSDDSTRKDIMDQIVKYKQEELQALVNDDVTKFTTVTDDWKEDRAENIDEFVSSGSLYQGTFKAMKFDLNSFTTAYEEGLWKVTVNAEGTFNESTYETGETPELEDTTDDFTFTVVYDEKTKKWLVNHGKDTYSFNDKKIKEITVENPVQYTSSGTTEAAGGTDDASMLEDFIKEYFETSVDSYNSNRFTLAEPYLDPNGLQYKSQKDYTSYIYNKNIKEKLLGVEDISVTPNGDNTYNVASQETFEITYDDGSVTNKTFKSNYLVVINNGKPQINKMLSDEQVN
ncbi:zinc ribbon domain-containing protein [Neobacillus sp. Marseille-QA0830]